MAALLTESSRVMCQHGGQASPTLTNPRVKVNGSATVTTSGTYTVSACPYTIDGAPSPCVSAQWLAGASRVRSGGVRLVLENSQATCTPNATGVQNTALQSRVRGI